MRSFDEATAFSTMAREESACCERDRAISDWCGKNAHFRFPSPGPVEMAMSIAADFVLLMRRVSWSGLQGAALPVCVCVKCIITLCAMFLEEDPHDVRGTFNIVALCAMYHCKD